MIIAISAIIPTYVYKTVISIAAEHMVTTTAAPILIAINKHQVPGISIAEEW